MDVPVAPVIQPDGVLLYTHQTPKLNDPYIYIYPSRMDPNAPTYVVVREEAPEPIFTVAGILDMRGDGRQREYLVRWDGYGSDGDTWEPGESFFNKRFLG